LSKTANNAVDGIKEVIDDHNIMELYIKAGPNGDGQVGDCPFAHYVRCVLWNKGLDYKVLKGF
jgi:hypothetical protein